MKFLGTSLIFFVFALFSENANALNIVRPNAIEVCFEGVDCSLLEELGALKNLTPKKIERVQRAKIILEVDKGQLSSGGWLFIGEVGDSALVTLNGHIILDLRDGAGKNQYYRYLSLIVPIPPDFLAEKNNLVFEITDLNQTIFGIRGNLSVGTFYEVIIKATIDFLMRTGSSLLSAFTLIFLTLCSLIAFYFIRNRQLLFLSLYGLVSVLYLLSFSEIPRSLYDPILLSGPFHFSFRFLQDLMLCLLLITVLRFTKRKPQVIALVSVYLCACLSLWLTYFTNYDFPHVQKVMFFCAPLVAFPTVFGFYLSRNLPDISERTWGIRFWGILVLVQLNDLFVFWQVYDGYFLVKWYIPLLFTFVFFIIIRRAALSGKEQAIELRLGSELRQFAHDIRSPIGALNVAVDDIAKKTDISEARDIIQLSLERINEVSSFILGNQRTSFLNSSVSDLLKKSEKISEAISMSRKIPITFSANVAGDTFFLPLREADLIRVVENILQNSCNACSNPGGHISVKCSITAKSCTIVIRDNGPGFPPKVLAGIGRSGVGNQTHNSTGLGLAFSVQVIELAHGRVQIGNIKPNGAEVKIHLPLYITPKYHQ